VDAQTNQRQRFSAKLFFLCASTIGSTQILMNSTSEQFPNGLANRSGALGHCLMDHSFGQGAAGIFLDDIDKYYSGNRPIGLYIPRFRNVGKQDEDADFVRGYGYQTMTMRQTGRAPIERRGRGRT
jgi:choline dehydrogenase-like flavoprotein